MKRTLTVFFAMLLVLSLATMAFAQGGEGDEPVSSSEFFNAEDYARQMSLLEIEPEGSADMPWAQMILGEGVEMVDTSEYATEGPWTVCFSNAGNFNPWRVVGYNTMEATVETYPEIEEFIVLDGEGSDEKQISDIADLLAGEQCDLLIVSPVTTAALTPAVEQACEALPVIVFDRGVLTDCPVSFIAPIGGYAFGDVGANFIAEELGEEGGTVLALRISPGVDVLETRWAAAEQIFMANENIEVVGVEFTGDDRATARGIVEDYLDRYGTIDAVWMDAGATSLVVIEAFEDMGVDVPIITGEDQQDFLVAWQEGGLSAIAPTYPTFQWRTAIDAAVKILSGEEVPSEWILPQPFITNENLDEYVQPNMPPQHYALCGCEDLPGFPERWGGEEAE